MRLHFHIAAAQTALLLALVSLPTETAAGLPREFQSDAVARAQADSTSLAKRLSSRNPIARREAAEDLARSAMSENRRLLETFRVQEGDASVKVAMDWALYRMGKNEALFPVVRALDSKQVELAVKYLSTIEAPDPLYIFLKRVNGKTLIRLLEVLAKVGDERTLESVKEFSASLDPGIAEAARFAEREIMIRLQETPVPEAKRARRTGTAVETEP